MIKKLGCKCTCGGKAVCWLDDGTPLCGVCFLKSGRTALALGLSVVLKAPGKPDMVITPSRLSKN